MIFVCYTFALSQVCLALLQKVIITEISLLCQVLNQTLLHRPNCLDFFHQNACSLSKQFQLTFLQAHSILMSSPSCRGVAPAPLAEGVNPRGLTADSIWQTDVTHISEFGCLKYVHVSVDTCSHFLMATAHTREKARNVIQHWLICFATLGLPDTIEMDNGPAYTYEWTRQFLQQWGVSQNTGIPHVPTGQAIVEHAHRTLKMMLEKQKKGESRCPHDRLAKALYVRNFLN